MVWQLKKLQHGQLSMRRIEELPSKKNEEKKFEIFLSGKCSIHIKKHQETMINGVSKKKVDKISYLSRGKNKRCNSFVLVLPPPLKKPTA